MCASATHPLGINGRHDGCIKHHEGPCGYCIDMQMNWLV